MKKLLKIIGLDKKGFREATKIQLPKLIFVLFSSFIIWKTHEKLKILDEAKGEVKTYTAKSIREEGIEEDNKKFEEMIKLSETFSIENELNREIKEKMKYNNMKNKINIEDTENTIEDSILNEFEDLVKKLNEEN